MHLKPVAMAAALVALTGCGVIYTAPRVHDGAPLGNAYGTAYDVEVVPMTYATAAAANLVPYVPARLPLAFQPEAVEMEIARARAEPVYQAAAPVDQAALAANVSYGLPPPGLVEPYRIGVGDEVLLSVSGPTTLEGLPSLISAQAKRDAYTVQDDGTVAIPDVGRVRVGGLTLQAAEREVTDALLAAGIDPAFTLEVAGFNSQRVAVGGAVASPTILPVTLQPIRLSDAIALAGGVTVERADAAVVQLFRDGRIYQLGLDRLVNDPGARGIVLRDGDTVYVGGPSDLSAADARLEIEDLRQGREEFAGERLAGQRALFRERLELDAVDRHFAFLTGEVRNPGLVPLPFERQKRLAEVLFPQTGGGIPTQTGDYGEIYVLRAASDPRQAGGLTAYHLDAENAVNLAVAALFQLRPNDVVFVAEQPVTSWNRAFSQILPQLSGVLALPGRALSGGLSGG